MPNQSPNLLFIYTDEQAFNTLAAYGNTQIEMPNLNRFSSQSTVFEQAYVTQPVCTPSRSSLLTGLYPHTNGCIENNIPLRDKTPCLPEMVSRDDYVTGHFGKWHLGDELYAQHGFEEWIGIEDNYNRFFRQGLERDRRSGYHDFLVESGFTPKNSVSFGRYEASQLPEKYSKPSFLAREASRFLREHKEDPFILYINFLEPHMPFFGPRDDQYNPADIPLPPNIENWPDRSNPLKTRVYAEVYRNLGKQDPRIPLETTQDWQRLIARYWGLCSQVDTHAGTILDALEECGLDENTIVVFTSDHGDMMGSHRLMAKCVMFEEAVRVPMLIRLPGQTEGRRVSGPVSQVDLIPTLLDLLGEEIPMHLQGRSLRPFLEGDVDRSDRDVFIEWNGCNTGIVGETPGAYKVPAALENEVSPEELDEAVHDPVRTIITPDGWKLNHSPRGEHELYDLNNDPHERQNLAGQPEQAERIRELHARIIAWQERTGDGAALGG